MSTTNANIYVDQGTDFSIALELFENDGTDYEIALNSSFYCNVKKLYSTTTAFTVELEVVAGDGGNNDLSFYISPEKTRNLQPGKYQYDILMVTGGGSISKILEGLMFILPTTTTIPG